MLRFSIFLFLSLLPQLVWSQATVTVGKPYGVVDAPIKQYFQQGNDILGIKIEERLVTLQKWNAGQLTFKGIKTYDDMPRGYVLENILEFNDRFYVFYSLWDKQKELEQLFAREIDFAQGTFKGEGKRILTVEGKITGTLARTGFYRYNVQDKFDFHTSFDDSKLLVQYRLKPAVRSDAKNYDLIGMHVLNRDLTPLWKKEVEMPYTEKKMNNLDYTVDSEGNTYILTTVYDDNTTDIKKSKNGIANYHIELLRIKPSTPKIDITPVTVADKFINKIWFYEGATNELVCAGLYNKGNSLSSANGIVMFKVKQDGSVSNMATYEIPVSVLNQFESERTQRKNLKKEADDKAEFEDLELQEIIIEDDGSLLLVGEQHYIKEHTSFSNNNYRTWYTYHYDDLLISKISPAGELEWMRKLPKHQFGTNGKGGMSYKYMRAGNSHYFLYLDNEENMELPLNKIPARHADGNRGFLTAYTIYNGSGEVRKTSILDTQDIDGMKVYQFLTSRILPLTSDTFVFEVYKKNKEDILVRVQLKE